MVATIHNIKEKLKGENDELKKIKHKLKEIQEKQKAEKEVCWRENNVGTLCDTVLANIFRLITKNNNNCMQIVLWKINGLFNVSFVTKEAKSQTSFMKGNSELRHKIEVNIVAILVLPILTVVFIGRRSSLSPGRTTRKS
jgi:hypothetical protein